MQRRWSWAHRLALLALAACWAHEPSTPPLAPPSASMPGALPPLYGFWGLNGRVDAAGLLATSRALGMTVFHTATIDAHWAATELLPMVQAAGLRVTLRLTGPHSRYTSTTGDFDPDAWKAMLVPWAAEADALAPFIADGTLAGHMLLDDIYTFEGRAPTAAELDELARLSKAILPGLMTFVREKATGMPPGTYRHLDAVVNQYKAAEGDVQRYALREAAQARALGVGVINGLNIANGGDGSSGQPGWGAGRFAMSADEIRAYGAVLAAVPECGMFLNWEYDHEEVWSDGSIGGTYFDRPALQQALRDLGAQVQAHPPVLLLRPPPPESP